MKIVQDIPSAVDSAPPINHAQISPLHSIGRTQSSDQLPIQTTRAAGTRSRARPVRAQRDVFTDLL